MVATETTLRDAAAKFHQIVASISARRMIDKNGEKMPQPMRDKLAAALLHPGQLQKIASDGFEACIRALHAMGADDVTIRECQASDMEEHW